MRVINPTFIIRTDKERKDGKCPINIRVSMDNKVAKLMTGVSLFVEDWSKETGFVKRGRNLDAERKRLNACMMKLEEFIDKKNLYDRPFNMQDLKDAYKGVDNKGFFDYYDEFVKHKEINDKISVGTSNIYNVLRKQLFEYKPDLKIGEVDKRFVERFFIYLKTCKGVNSPFNKRKNLNTFFTKMKKDGLIDINPIEDIPIPETKRRYMFLTKKEQLDFCNVKTEGTGLELTQDVYEFSCYTGLRYGDAFHLRRNEIVDNMIIKEQEKVNKEVRVPLKPRALEILEKYNYQDKKGNELIFPQKENAPVNRDLKILAKMAGINKPLIFHSARHTFGTRLAENGVNAFMIMKMMGHSDVSTTMIYIQDDKEILNNAMAQADFV